MNTRNKIRVGASVLFGAIVAILAVTGSSALATVAIIGGIALGALYVVTGMVGQPASPRVRSRR